MVFLPAVIAMDWVGVDNVIRTAHHMGITTIEHGNDCGLALTLGCGEVKLLDMTYAFSVFDNLGVMIGEERPEEQQRFGYRDLDPVAILHVEDKDGNVIYVGKAKDLRSRVRSYFYGDDRRSVAQMLRDLADIDFRVCATELEAEVTEVRLIHAHAPRYNRRSRPPKSTQYVKLTAEEFPRLSVVRTLRDDGCLYLGPFRSRRIANVVVAAIWDAVPIRRCMTKGGKRSPACSFSQLGVALCPCDGSVPAPVYQAVVNQLRRGIEQRPGDLLEPLVERMVEYARTARFEEAAELRDRHRALARALEDRRIWEVLDTAGLLLAEDQSGESALIEGGRLVAAWKADEQPPLTTTAATAPSPYDVASSVALAEEARLIWRWLDRPGVRIVDSTNPLATSLHPVPVLTSLAG